MAIINFKKILQAQPLRVCELLATGGAEVRRHQQSWLAVQEHIL